MPEETWDILEIEAEQGEVQAQRFLENRKGTRWN